MYHLEVCPYRQREYTYLDIEADLLEQTFANRVKDIKVTLLGRKIQHIDRVIGCPDKVIKYPEEMLKYRYKMDRMNDRNGRLQEDEIIYSQRQTEKGLHELHDDFDIILEKELERRIYDASIIRTFSQNVIWENDSESSELRYQLKQTKRKLTETEADRDKAYALLKERNNEFQQNIGEENRESSKLRYQLQQTMRELKDTKANADKNITLLKEENKDFSQNIVKKNRELSELRYQLQQSKIKVKENEGNMDKANALLKEKNREFSQNMVKEKDHELSELRYQLKQTKRELKETETKADKADAALKEKNQEFSQNIEEKDHESSELRYQLQQTMRKLKETEANADKAYASLKEKNLSFQVEMKRRDQKIENLKEMLESEKKEINDSEERQLRSEMGQKDYIITDLNHQLKMALERPVKIEMEMNGIISSLKKHNADLQKEIELRDMKTKDSLDFIKKERIELNEYVDNKVKEKEFQLREQNDQHQNSLQKMQEKETEMKEVIASLKKKIKQLEAEMEHRNLNIKQLEKELNSKKIGIAAIKEPDVTEMEDKINQLTDQLDQTLAKLQDTKTELDETKTRLSKAMGNMLTDNNPNIADLSDKNRPTKLSERYAELYDNQWTDAFDILEKYLHAEENAITALLHILKDAMTFCRNKANEQMKDVRGVLALSNDKKYGGISADLGKLLKDCRKAMASTAVGNLYMMYMSHINQSSDGTTRAALQVGSFTKECLEVCWFMAIQDPPVVFAPELRKGSKFNTDLFKPYTSSGTHVDYIVWPALLLHEGGPVLAKGVAQGDGKKAT